MVLDAIFIYESFKRSLIVRKSTFLYAYLEKIQSLFISFQQSKEGQEMLPEQIKAVLLDSAGLHGVV